MAAQEKRKEFCAILGVDEQASKEEIKRAYKQLALQCHPDKNQLNPEATREFQKISEAYTGLCQEDIDSADEDINDFDGGVSLFELLQLFFSINRRRPFFMRSPSSWFSRYSEDSDEVNDSDDACGPVRQNIRNHAGQQAWHDDNHFVPGNARPQSSSKDAGKTGKAKKRKNRRGGGGGAASSQNNNNQSSDRQGTNASAGTNASTGSNTSASTNAGTAENRTSTLDQDGLATEATSENQLPGRAGVNDQGANQGSGSDAKPGIIPEPATDNNNSGENPERRGSNGSLRGTGQISQGQAAEKKPNKKKLQAEQRIREKEYAEIHRAVLEKNRKEEEKRKKKMEKEKAKLDTEFTPKLNAMARDENKTAVNDCMPEVDPSAERQNDRHGASAETNDAKDPETSDTGSLDSDSRLAKHMEGGLSLESSETIDSIGIEEITSDNGQPSADRKASAVSFDEERFDENHPEIGCNGDAVGSSQGERQKFTRVFYGHSSKNQSKNNPRYNRNFDNADGGNTVGGHFPPQRGSGYRGRVDNANYRPHTNNSGFVDRSFYRGFHNNSERDGPQNNDDQSGCTTSEEANSNAGVKDSSGPANRGQYGRGRYRGNRMRYQNTRFRNASELPDDQSKSTNCDGPGQDVDRNNGVVAVDMKPSGDGTSLDSTQNLPNSEFRSHRGTDESSVREGSLLSCNGHRGGYAADNSETSKKGYWPRSNRNFRGQRGNFRGGFDGGGVGKNNNDQNHPSGGFRSKPVQECWDSEGSKSHIDQVESNTVEMPVAERGKGQHRGRRPDRGGFQRGGRGGGRAFNSSNSQENWDLEGRTGNRVDQVDDAKEVPVHETSNEPYRGSRPDRGHFQRDGGGRGRGRGFGQARDRTGEAQPRGNRAAEWEPGKKRFERGSSSNYDCEEYNGAMMQFHRRRQTPGEAVQVPPSASNPMAQHQSQSDSAAASDGGMEWTSRSSEGHPVDTSGPRNVWKDRQEFYEGALPRSKEEEDAMLRAALQLSELEIEEQRLSEQVQSSGLSLSFTSSSVVGRSSEVGWTADVLDIVTVEPHPPRQRPAENVATDNAHARLQPQDGQAEDDRRGTSEGVERLVVPTARLKSWADEMEETNDTGANADAYPSDTLAESDADSVRSSRIQGKVTHNSWALMNFGTHSDAASSEEAKNLPSNHSESEIKAVVSTVRDTIVHPTAPGISPSSAMQLNRDVSDGVVRPRDMPGTSEQLGAREPLQRQTSMLDDIDDGAVEKENPQNMPADHIHAASASAIESRVFHASPFPPFARHMPEAENPTAPDFSVENNRGEAVVDLPVSPGLPCPAFPPGPMPPLPPWMQPGCPTYFVAVPGYPPWYPMPPYQHYWPYMPSGAPGMPGVMPMVSQSLSLAHSSSVTDQPTVSQHLPMSHPNSLPLQGPSAVPHLPPSMPTMMHPIPYGYPPHPAHMGHPGAAMHVPFAPYTMSPSETVGSTALLQETGSPTNYMDESKRCA